MSGEKRKRLEVTCLECKKVFTVSARDFCRKYCSSKCYRSQYKKRREPFVFGVKAEAIGLNEPRKNS